MRRPKGSVNLAAEVIGRAIGIDDGSLQTLNKRESRIKQKFAATLKTACGSAVAQALSVRRLQQCTAWNAKTAGAHHKGPKADRSGAKAGGRFPEVVFLNGAEGFNVGRRAGGYKRRKFMIYRRGLRNSLKINIKKTYRQSLPLWYITCYPPLNG